MHCLLFEYFPHPIHFFSSSSSVPHVSQTRGHIAGALFPLSPLRWGSKGTECCVFEHAYSMLEHICTDNSGLVRYVLSEGRISTPIVVEFVYNASSTYLPYIIQTVLTGDLLCFVLYNTVIVLISTRKIISGTRYTRIEHALRTTR